MIVLSNREMENILRDVWDEAQITGENGDKPSDVIKWRAESIRDRMKSYKRVFGTPK